MSGKFWDEAEATFRDTIAFYAGALKVARERVRKARDPVTRYDKALARFTETGEGLDKVKRAITPRVAQVIAQRETEAAEAKRKALETQVRAERIKRMTLMAERMRRRNLMLARTFRAIACVLAVFLVVLVAAGLVALWHQTGPHYIGHRP